MPGVDLRNHLIIGQQFTDRSFTIQCKEGEFILPDAEVLVWRKGDVHLIRANQIGDGMQVIYVSPRERLQANTALDGSFFLGGMSIYYEYDEEKNKTTVYLYKHAKDAEELEYINNILDRYQLAAYTKQEGRFVILYLEGDILPIVSTLGDSWNFPQHLSFFLGLLVAYPSGRSIMEQQKRLTTRKSTIPLVGSIASYEKQIQELVTSLQEGGIFVTSTMQKEKIGSVLQITVTDREILGLLAELLGQKESTSRREFFDFTLKASIQALLSLQNKSYQDTFRQLDDSVLKLITK